jgi:hypothetical protein
MLGAALVIVTVASAADTMPVARQNALVKQYCSVCHTDAARNGGLSLEHFDAARPDPGDAAMMVSKLKTGALGAAGITPPDQATREALISALIAASAGANQWVVNQQEKSASIVQEVPPNLYRLTLNCRDGAQLAWSPGVPEDGRMVSAAADGKPAVKFAVEGTEKMGDGSGGNSGPGAYPVPLAAVPEKALIVSGLFGEERVVFPFDTLPPSVRRELSNCGAYATSRPAAGFVR